MSKQISSLDPIIRPSCLRTFFKWPISGLFFFIFIFSMPVDCKRSIEILLGTGFKSRTSGVGSNRSTNWATNTLVRFSKHFSRQFFVSKMPKSKERNGALKKCHHYQCDQIGHFGQLFKEGGNNYFAEITHILGNFRKGVKIFHFSSEIIFG